MVLSLQLFTFIIILGIVGGIGSLSTLVSLLMVEKQHEYLKMEKKKNDLEYLLKDAQMSNLSSKMQPHFLFNSLNTVSSLIRLDKSQDAIHSIQAISSLLRYTLKDSQQLVTMEEELNSVQMYLQIQKMRFGKRLDWTIECPKDCYSIKIPMLSIQPLVENACKHGIEPSIKGGFIKITVEKDEIFTIRIHDNGVGISEQVIELFADWKKNKRKPDDFGIGIINTYERIKHVYGDQSNVTIANTPTGTICSIIIREVSMHENTLSR